MLLRTLTDLAGKDVIGWIGEEMALSEEFEDSQVLWQHSSVPFLQFIQLDALLEGGGVFTLLSQLDDGHGFYGLYSPAWNHPRLVEESYIPGSIYRTRTVSELPVGRVIISNVVTDGTGNIVDVYLKINNTTVRIASGEVYERDDDAFDIIYIDESLLVQVSSSL